MKDTLEIGGYSCTCLRDTPFAVDGGALFHMAPKIAWSKRVTPDELNRVTLGVNCLLLRGYGRTILIDAGVGEKLTPRDISFYKIDRSIRLLDNLAAIGVAPEEIDIVVLTHLHLDHTGWLTRRVAGGLAPVFANARHYVQQREWEAALHPNELTAGSYVLDDLLPVEQAGLWTRVEGDTEIAPGVHLHLTGAHSAGHQMVRIVDGGHTLLCPCDILPTEWHMRLAWAMSYDIRAYDVVEVKREWMQRAEAEGWYLFLTHTPYDPFGRLERIDARAYRWMPESITQP